MLLIFIIQHIFNIETKTDLSELEYLFHDITDQWEVLTNSMRQYAETSIKKKKEEEEDLKQKEVHD